VAGNVFDVELNPEPVATPAASDSEIPPIEISIDEANLSTETDPNGSFELSGDFSGPTTVRFSDPDSGEDFGTISVEVPSGSTVVLRDVGVRLDLDVPIQLPQRPIVLNLFGTLVRARCADNVVVVDGEDITKSPFTVNLHDGTEIVGPDGNPFPCDELVPGDRVGLDEGVVDLGDLSIDAVKLEVNPTRHPAEIIVIRRRGLVIRRNCSAGLIHFEDLELQDVIRLRVSGQTEILCAESGPPRPCGCSDVEPGKLIEVEGSRDPSMPTFIKALRVSVVPRPAQITRKIVGDVTSINCAAGRMRMTDVRLADSAAHATQRALAAVPIELTGATVFRCKNHEVPECACTDVNIRDRVEVEASLVAGAETRIRALAVTVVASPKTRVVGTAAEVDCASGRLLVKTHEEDFELVQIEGTTVIRRPRRKGLTCGDLAPGDRLNVRARLRATPDAGGGVLIAEEILVVARGTMPGPRATPIPVSYRRVSRRE